MRDEMELWKCECKWHGEVRTLIICDLIEAFLLINFFFAIYNDKWTPGPRYGEYELRAQKYASLFALRKAWRTVELFNYKVECLFQTFNEFQVKLNGNSQCLLALQCVAITSMGYLSMSQVKFLVIQICRRRRERKRERAKNFVIILVLLLPGFK